MNLESCVPLEIGSRMKIDRRTGANIKPEFSKKGLVPLVIPRTSIIFRTISKT